MIAFATTPVSRIATPPRRGSLLRRVYPRRPSSQSRTAVGHNRHRPRRPEADLRPAAASLGHPADPTAPAPTPKFRSVDITRLDFSTSTQSTNSLLTKYLVGPCNKCHQIRRGDETSILSINVRLGDRTGQRASRSYVEGDFVLNRF